MCGDVTTDVSRRLPRTIVTISAGIDNVRHVSVALMECSEGLAVNFVRPSVRLWLCFRMISQKRQKLYHLQI